MQPVDALAQERTISSQSGMRLNITLQFNNLVVFPTAELARAAARAPSALKKLGTKWLAAVASLSQEEHDELCRHLCSEGGSEAKRLAEGLLVHQCDSPSSGPAVSPQIALVAEKVRGMVRCYFFSSFSRH